MTNLTFDPESGALYIRLREGTPYEALDLAEPELGAYVHIDEHGNVLALEFLSLRELAEVTTGGIDLPDRIEDPANWEPSELLEA